MEERTAGAVADRVGTGSSALGVFAHSLNGKVLRAHAKGALRTGELEDLLPWAPQTSLRLAVSDMRKLGTLVKVEPARGARGAANELTVSGDELLPIGVSLEHWLRLSPSGPLALLGVKGSNAIKALIAGWDSTIVRELAEQSRTHVELCLEIPAHSHPALGRRIRRLRSSQLIAPIAARESGIPYEVSEWLRLGVAPLSVGGRWERRYILLPTADNARLDVEATFFLALPLVELARGTSGVCTFAMTPTEDGVDTEHGALGITVQVTDGVVVSCLPTDLAEASTSVLGTPDAWLEAVIEGKHEALQIEGEDPALAVEILSEMHNVLFV